MIFEDNGIGLTEAEIEQFLASIGSSSKSLDVVAKGKEVSFIGQFGIGMLSCFTVSEKIAVVRTLTDNEEGKVIANRIFDLKLQEGNPTFNDFAILYRTNKKLLLLLYRSFGHVGIVHLDSRQRVDHPKNTTTMVERVAGPAAWFLYFPAAPPWQPLRKGLTEGGVAGFN